VPPHCAQSHHLYYLLLPTPADRQALIAHFAARDIRAVFHYLPLHLSPVGQRMGGRTGDCPVTEDISERLLRLPFFTSMTDDEQTRVLAAIQEFQPAS
jgi:dTDP-4-amino-4,6-dideoxygalactose transaminase